VTVWWERFSNRPSFQSPFACSIRSFELDTKFHQICRLPSMGAADEHDARVGFRAQAHICPGHEDEHATLLSVLGVTADHPIDDVGSALGVLAWNRELGSGGHGHVHVEEG
jgi:hypothetical protein